MSELSSVVLLESSHKFYTKHGFLPSPSDPLQLFFPLDALRK